MGEASYQEALCRICGRYDWSDTRFDCTAVVIPDPANPYDSNAVAIQVNAEHVGYLSRGDALDYQPAVQAFAAQAKVIVANAVIAGRGPESETRNLGIFLKLPPPQEALDQALS